MPALCLVKGMAAILSQNESQRWIIENPVKSGCWIMEISSSRTFTISIRELCKNYKSFAATIAAMNSASIGFNATFA